jgi:hypothetical protein
MDSGMVANWTTGAFELQTAALVGILFIFVD